MAEIILAPTAQSKVIPLSIRLNDTDTSLVSQLVTNKQFSTADTDAWFSFTLEGLAATTGTFDLTLINLQDKSVFNHTDKVFSTNPFYYKLDSGTDELTNEIRHAGKWVGQLVVTLPNGDSATRKFIFAIEGHILDGTVVQTILLEDYNALIASIESAKDELTQYNIDYSTLISTVESQEAARVQAELTREQTFNALVDSEIIAQNVATELQNVEATYAPRLLSAEQQLADIKKQTVSVLDFGAIGDGVTSDSQAIQDAIDSGTNIIFPEGKTFLCKDIKLDSDKTLYMYGATLKCGGDSPVGKNSIENQQGIFYAYGTNLSYLQNISLFGGNFIGLRLPDNWTVQTSYELGDDMMQFSFINGLTIRDCILSESGQDGIELKSCKNVLVQGNTFNNMGDAGVEVRGEGQYVIKDNKFYRTRNALFMKGHEEYLHKIPRNVVFEGNYCETNFSSLIFHYSEDIKIKNNTLIKLNDLTEAQIGYNANGIDTEYPPVLGETNNIKNIEISGNVIKGFVTGHAIKIKRQTETAVVEGIKIYDNRFDTCLNGVYSDGDVSIYNNTFTNILGTLDTTYTIKCDNVPADSVCRIDGNKLIGVSCSMYLKTNRVKVSNNIHKGTGRFVSLENCNDGFVSENYSDCDLFIKLTASSNINLLSNNVKVTNTFIRATANDVSIKNNDITKSVNNYEYLIGLTGSNNVVLGNNITHIGGNPVIEFEATSLNGIISNNKIKSTGTSSCVRVYGARIVIAGNKTSGGNQGLRVYASECNINGNVFENAAYQGIHLMAKSSRNIINGNVSLGNTLNFEDLGVGNINSNNLIAS